MKHQFILFALLLIGACRTPAGTKDNQNTAAQKPAPANSEVLLKKVIGGMPDEEKKQDQYFECEVLSSDVEDAVAVKNWIAEVPRKLDVGYHIVAQSPSVQILAYEGSTPVIIYRDFSVMERPKAPTPSQTAAIEQLTKILDKKCPTPTRTK